jgi:hypothetical protein
MDLKKGIGNDPFFYVSPANSVLSVRGNSVSLTGATENIKIEPPMNIDKHK